MIAGDAPGPSEDAVARFQRQRGQMVVDPAHRDRDLVAVVVDRREHLGRGDDPAEPGAKPHRQGTQAPAGGVMHRVGDRRRGSEDAELADPLDAKRVRLVFALLGHSSPDLADVGVYRREIFHDVGVKEAVARQVGLRRLVQRLDAPDHAADKLRTRRLAVGSNSRCQGAVQPRHPDLLRPAMDAHLRRRPHEAARVGVGPRQPLTAMDVRAGMRRHRDLGAGIGDTLDLRDLPDPRRSAGGEPAIRRSTRRHALDAGGTEGHHGVYLRPRDRQAHRRAHGPRGGDGQDSAGRGPRLRPERPAPERAVDGDPPRARSPWSADRSAGSPRRLARATAPPPGRCAPSRRPSRRRLRPRRTRSHSSRGPAPKWWLAPSAGLTGRAIAVTIFPGARTVSASGLSPGRTCSSAKGIARACPRLQTSASKAMSTRARSSGYIATQASVPSGMAWMSARPPFSAAQPEPRALGAPGTGGVAETGLAGALEINGGEARHVATLRARRVLPGLAQRRGRGDERGVVGHLGHPRQRAEADALGADPSVRRIRRAAGIGRPGMALSGAGDGRQDPAGRAVATLEGVVFGEGRLHRVQAPFASAGPPR